MPPLRCLLFGHDVDNRRFAAEDAMRCRCGLPIARDGTDNRVGHTLSCFVLGHHYERIGERDGHNEYVCLDCGHPLLFASDDDPYDTSAEFAKRVRYSCNLLGHEVRKVTERHGSVEYACRCGHTFLKPERGLTRVTHPPICTIAGHFITFVERRAGFDEFVCRNCGHTFCFTAVSS
jgi:hypothetical protein